MYPARHNTAMNASLAMENCPHIPLSAYNWKKSITFDPRCQESLPWNPTVYCVFAALHAITVWMSLSLMQKTLHTFKRWDTLYFW
jgi:hypothetical protein